MKSTLLPIALFSAAALAAQVGVNEPSPRQALDVNGKLEISDDARAPTAGTLRYNAAAGRFEGHDGTAWTDLGASATAAALPSGPVPVGVAVQLPTDGSVITVPFSDAADRTIFTVVPEGKALILTSVNVLPVGIEFDPEARYAVSLNPAKDPTTFPDYNFGYSLAGVSGESKHIDGALAPLIVVRAGEILRGQQADLANNAEAEIAVNLRGFLVDDLEY